MYSYIQDTTEVITLIENYSFNNKQQILVSLDIVSLYTCIPQDLTLEVLEEVLLEKRTEGECPNSFILWCAAMSLKENFFSFNQQLFQQVHGTAMGSSVAPSAANLFVKSFEKSVIYDPSNPFLNHLHLWRRYIDGILIIWDGDAVMFEDFKEWLNGQNPFLKFTATTSTTAINFLDITIWTDNSDNTLKVKPYHKPTDRNSLLQYDSCHPSHIRKNLPVGQFLRLKRNSSSTATFEEEATTLSCKLRRRGYPNKIARRAHKRAKNNNREALLEYHNISLDNDQIVFVSTFNTLSNKVNAIIKRNWHILDAGECPIKKTLCAFKRGPNIKDLVTRNDISVQSPQSTLTESWGLPNPIGHTPCGHCSCCSSTKRTKEIDLGLRKPWQQRQFTNCNSQMVVYVIWSLKCILE
ncbi:uncharacterized protein [Ambystoma mexicanum]|uniref:uncharacterized protein n=1 Tax=Ambystoma mexicanum TaxID=8296 RepID=UPI0037E7098B